MLKLLFCGCLLSCLLMAAPLAQAQEDQPPRKQELPTGPPMGNPPQQQPTIEIVSPEPQKARKQEKVQDEPVQKEKKERQPFTLKDRSFVGGGAGLSFSSSTLFGKTFYAAVSPMLGYKVTERLAFGPGLNYQYWGTDLGSFHNYGGRLFGQFIVVDGLFRGEDKLLIHSEYELMNFEALRFDAFGRRQNFRETIGTALVGLGYRQQISNRSALDFYLLYNATESIYSPYGPLVTRFGIIIDL